MKYNGLTELGRKYLAKIQANREPVKFVKIKFGNGTLQEHENPADFTDVKNIKVEKSILELKQSDDAVKLTTQIDNVGLDEGYYPRETGIYVLDDDREILYYYINDGTEVSYLPPEASGPVRFDISINLIATSDTAITVRNDGKDLYITKEYLDSRHLSKQEIENLLGFNVINQEFILATLDDIKNLFPGSGGTSGAFDLGHISSDSTKIVNMMLLSNYNEYLQQKILEIKSFFNNLNNEKADKTALSNYYTKQEIDSKVDTLESNKADKTALNEFYKKNVTYTKTEVDEMLNNKADSETVTTNLNDKANKTIQIIVGDGLLGSGTLESNINITVDKLNVTEIQNLLNNWR